MAGNVDEAQGDGRGNFFGVEGAVWAKVCQRGSLNEAIAYLVLARGSHMGTRKSSWSVEAIETRTNISRLRAKAALQDLVKSGLVRQLRAGTKPQYYLPTAYEIEKPVRVPVEVSAVEQQVLDMIKAVGELVAVPTRGTHENGWPETNIRSIANSLVLKGKLVSINLTEYVIAPEVTEVQPPKPEWTWLPNSLVDGIDDVTPPIEQVRQTQSLVALQLLVDLYYAQSLAFNGGVHWRQIRKEFSKELVGSSGIYDVWGFRQGKIWVWPTLPFIATHFTSKKEHVEGSEHTQELRGARLWDALAKLEQLGLLRFVPHVIDADTNEGEVVHPFGIGVGENIEQQIATAAHQAGFRLLNASKASTAREQGLSLIPLARHRSNAELVGLIRMTHRAHTAATADWLANADRWQKWVEAYEQIGLSAPAGQDARSKGPQRDIKGVSKGSKRRIKGG